MENFNNFYDFFKVMFYRIKILGHNKIPSDIRIIHNSLFSSYNENKKELNSIGIGLIFRKRIGFSYCEVFHDILLSLEVANILISRSDGFYEISDSIRDFYMGDLMSKFSFEQELIITNFAISFVRELDFS